MAVAGEGGFQTRPYDVKRVGPAPLVIGMQRPGMDSGFRRNDGVPGMGSCFRRNDGVRLVYVGAAAYI